MADRSFDAVVIGGGPAGEVAAARLAEGGLDVALVEQELVGGECAYWACMPSKALLRPAQALAEAARVPGARERLAETVPDPGATLRRRDEVVHGWDDASQLRWLEDRSITLIRGRGRLAGERLVRAGGELIEARRAVLIAVGSAGAIPPIDGLAQARPWTTREATEAQAVPARLAVLGGGPAGCELAQAFATLGARTTLIEAETRLLAREEPFASEHVAVGLCAAGVMVLTGASVTRVTRGENGVSVELEGGEPVEADELLVAAGRRPLTADLGLEELGLEGGGHLETDAHLRVPGHGWLYCVGDANGRALLTHEGKRQARIAAAHVLGDEHAALPDLGLPPRVVFTEPQVAAVGHTLASAREAGLDVRHADFEMDAIAGASFHGKGSPGTARLVVDRGRGVPVGATFTGVDVAEMLHAATIAVATPVPVADLWRAVPAFPTRSEVWLRLLEALARDERQSA